MPKFTTPNVPSFQYLTDSPKPKSADEVAAFNLDAAARNLPDEDFASEPTVIHAAANAAKWETRLQRLAACAGRSVIPHLIDSLTAELEAARAALRFASLDDFLISDHDFVAAVAAAEHVRLIELRLQSAQAAKVDVNRTFSDLTELRDLAGRATAELKSIRFELKKKAVLATLTEVEAV